MRSVSHRDPESDSGRAEAEIRAIEADYDDAWDSADLTRLMSVVETDIVILDPRGGISVGASEARRLLGDFLAGEGAGSTHESRCKQVSFVTDDVALFDGQATISGPNLPRPIVHDFTDVFVRRDGSWRIAHIRAYVYMEAGVSYQAHQPDAQGRSARLKSYDAQVMRKHVGRLSLNTQDRKTQGSAYMLTKDNWWIKPSLIISGVIWIGRAVLQIAFNPNYYDPRTLIDYLAVVGTSLELLTLALGVWGIAIAQTPVTKGKPIWNSGIILTCISAALAGIVNLVEDGLGLKTIGFLFPFSILALTIGLLVSGLAALRIPQLHRSIGWFFILCLAGLLTVELGGGIAVGLSLVALADIAVPEE